MPRFEIVPVEGPGHRWFAVLQDGTERCRCATFPDAQGIVAALKLQLAMMELEQVIAQTIRP